ncbi:family 1 glycosylhydrolase [Larkinella humicola]|uniref:Family 1 glycosylhydrolase n=1 Tax=Larkinella humicola TaxID=2607654 RepID=A0A5N1J6K4_9BACT|nr:family 1 glycosylhydrolase [Larkinella humicola]KAA9346337.1 family 1 glycosylhydrolase [Larkinella humicola]
MDTSGGVASPLALWGGIECTVNRVQNRYHDQLVRNGHHKRADDIQHFADLGLKTLRYPLLWERLLPKLNQDPDWKWADARMHLLQQVGIQPVIGLVHHGCGPRYATFKGEEFERRMPDYARQIAERYPWVDAYTPINEPLTTARFSGLYGHWYPHGKSDRWFATLLLRQCRATVKAMQQIRQVRPDAQLIQTEDLGEVHSTPLLLYQADWENERRWLSWDLLCGRVVPGHPMWRFFQRVGIPEREVLYLAENPCPPTVLGVNHYITSERYLDENVVNYPPHLCGTNGRHHYADTEVVRAAPDRRMGVAALVTQAWERYKIPIAITEAHLGAADEERMRWLWYVWNQALTCRNAGVDIKAVTVWALLGSFDWHCLVTRREGHYEPGVFTLKAGRLQPTQLAGLVQRLATHQPAACVVPEGAGWWEK